MILYSLRRTTSIDRNVSKSVPTKYGELKRINLSYSLKTKLWNSEDIDMCRFYIKCLKIYKWNWRVLKSIWLKWEYKESRLIYFYFWDFIRNDYGLTKIEYFLTQVSYVTFQ